MSTTTKAPASGKSDQQSVDDKMEMSEADKQLKDELTNCINLLLEEDVSQHLYALNTLTNLIKVSTASMTSVPKPLKFLKPHYDSMKEIYEKMANPQFKIMAADIMSVLSMTKEGRDCLNYRLLSGYLDGIGSWGHEYVRHLAGEISAEWGDFDENTDATRKEMLLKLCKYIVEYDMQHNAESEACDLLCEVERLDMLEPYVDVDNYSRVCLYLVSCVPYVADPENVALIDTALLLYRKFEQYPQALRLAMQVNDENAMKDLFVLCRDTSIQRQMAFMMGRQHYFVNIARMTPDCDELMDIMGNCGLNGHFMNLARELDIVEPKSPEEVYKSHLENTRPQFGSNQVDSARQNLAASFVNGFVNAGFGQDKLLMNDGNKWLYKNKEHGMMSATASLGLILLWDVDGGLTPIDKYLYSSEDQIRAGAMLACGIVNCGIRSDCDPALALLGDYTTHHRTIIRVGSILGLGLAYAGSSRKPVFNLLHSIVTTCNTNMEEFGVLSISIGLVCVGTNNSTMLSAILQCLKERSESEIKEPYSKFVILGMGLILLGQQQQVNEIIKEMSSFRDPFKSMSITILEICAYCGTGNVLKVQQLLHICSEHLSDSETESSTSSISSRFAAHRSNSGEMKEHHGHHNRHYHHHQLPKESATRQAVAVIGISLISMGEDVGAEMAFRTFGHLLRYSDPPIRRAVPLALGLLCVSNPKLNILDTLSKFSHDTDSEVAYNAIFAMGLVGAGTNHARLGAMLRQLAQYHAKDPNSLFMVRIAQGLMHLGKGTLSLSPFRSDRQLLSPVAIAGLLSTLFAFLDVKNLILGKAHYMLYILVVAIHPRMLVTFDEDLNPLPVPVRVGMAVDVVGQAGKPKTITGFQTHTTPVLLGFGERAELATEEYVALTPVMEGFVILRKNPDFKAN